MNAFLLAVALVAAPAPRPILISVDDLPIASGKLHPDAAERLKITNELLAVLAKHHVPAIGMVVGKNHPTGDEFTYFGDTVPGHIQGASVAAKWKLDLDGKPPATGSTLLVLRPRGDGWEILQDASM